MNEVTAEELREEQRRFVEWIRALHDRRSRMGEAYYDLDRRVRDAGLANYLLDAEIACGRAALMLEREANPPCSSSG